MVEEYNMIGDFTNVCLTNPTNCGSNGGSMSFWIFHTKWGVFQIIGTTPADHAGFSAWLYSSHGAPQMR